MHLVHEPFTPNVSLQKNHSFGLAAQASYFASPTDLPQLQAALRAPVWRQAARRLVLGGGSNIVFTQDFAGAVIAPRLRGVRLLPSTATDWLVEVAAGEIWHDTVSALMAQGLPGLENLALIPGTVGAAPMQNIGAYGLELKDRFAWLDALNRTTGMVERFDLAACRFGYRDSVFKQAAIDQYVIVSVTLALPKQWRPVAGYADIATALQQAGITEPSGQHIFDAVVAIRRAKLPDPAKLGNAGSFFKNPVLDAALAVQLKQRHPGLPVYPQTNGSCKLAAAWLIEQAGCKALRRGAVGVYEKQALVLVNYGGACGADVLALAAQIQAAVWQAFGVRLEAEPSLL